MGFSERPRVVHITSVHRWDDNRIRYKECRSLASAGWDVYLVAQSRMSESFEDGVKLIAVDPAASRVDRLLRTGPAVVETALSLRPDIIHFHDPELLPLARRMSRGGAKVIYDVHEDNRATVQYKGYVPRIVRGPLGEAVRSVELRALRHLSAVVAATPQIADIFTGSATPVVVVQNFPRLEELALQVPFGESVRGRRLVYVGRNSVVRGARDMVAMMRHLPVDVGLDIAGDFSPASLEGELRAMPHAERVLFHGHCDRQRVAELLSAGGAGLLLLHPEANYLESYPTKMFEYMAAGLPVIASDFPLWRSIVDSAGCGILVEPQQPAAAAAAALALLDSPERAAALGAAGRRAARQQYSWDAESAKLIRLYDTLLSSSRDATVSE